ncbi:MAG: alpha/beta fold hydrolase [Tissierellia bacterium]|nr:alpha/beta fold hydrolase [Tissierellia bacterium]
MRFWIFSLGLALALFIFIARRKSGGPSRSIPLLLGAMALVFYTALRVVFPLLPMAAPTGPAQVVEERIFYRHPTAFPAMATEGPYREIPLRVYRPRELEPGAHPALIFSHGSFGVASSNETLFHELASRGYLVFSLDHPHHSFFSRGSSGKLTLVDGAFFREVVASRGGEDPRRTLEELSRWLGPRVEDLNFILDELLDGAGDQPLEEMVDPEGIVLAGHSLGGSAALALGRERPEDILALVILEAPFAGDIVGIRGEEFLFVEEEYPRPILHIYSDALWGRMDEITTYGQNVRLLSAQSPKFSNLHLEGVGHLGLTDFSRTSPLLTHLLDGGLDEKSPREALGELNEGVLEFLEELEE